MTKFSKSRTALGLAAISSVAVLGCTAIAADSDTMTRAAHAQSTAPFACTVTVERSGGLLVLEPVVQATEAVAGIYMLRVEGPGTRMNQGGPFSVRAGQTIELGRLQMTGNAASLEAELILTVDGRDYACPVDL